MQYSAVHLKNTRFCRLFPATTAIEVVVFFSNHFFRRGLFLVPVGFSRMPRLPQKPWICMVSRDWRRFRLWRGIYNPSCRFWWTSCCTFLYFWVSIRPSKVLQPSSYQCIFAKEVTSHFCICGGQLIASLPHHTQENVCENELPSYRKELLKPTEDTSQTTEEHNSTWLKQT